MSAFCVLTLAVLVGTTEAHVVGRDLSDVSLSDNFVLPTGRYPVTSRNQPCFDTSKCPGPQCQKIYVVEKNVKANWFQASILCAKKGWRLATVNNRQEETQLVQSLQKSAGSFLDEAKPNAMSSNSGSLMEVWLGATDLGQARRFTWMSSGQPVTYTHWYQGQPTFTRQYKPCVVLYKVGQNFHWFNVGCYQKHTFACEYFKTNQNKHPDIDWKG